MKDLSIYGNQINKVTVKFYYMDYTHQHLNKLIFAKILPSCHNAMFYLNQKLHNSTTSTGLYYSEHPGHRFVVILHKPSQEN